MGGFQGYYSQHHVYQVKGIVDDGTMVWVAALFEMRPYLERLLNSGGVEHLLSGSWSLGALALRLGTG